MKFVLMFGTPKDPEETRRRNKKLEELSKKAKEAGETSSLKAVSPVYAYADLSGGFQILEAEKMEDIVELVVFYFGTAEFKLIPIIESSKAFEFYDELAKL